MRLLLFLFLIPIFVYSQTSVEVAYKLRLSKNENVAFETFVAFDSVATDSMDFCCDATTFGPPGQFFGLYTKIGNNYYYFNYLSKLTYERSVPLYTFANPDTGTFTLDVVDTVGYETTILGLSDSFFPDQRFNFPYTTVGPVTGQRFTLHTTAPVKIDVINGCENDGGGTILIHNPNQMWTNDLIRDGEIIDYDIDSITSNLPSGTYQYKWYNQTGNQVINFEVNNNQLNFDLILPYNYLWIQDPGIIPEVLITGNYDQIIWNFGDGSELLYNDINPVHFYSETGIYTLSVTVTLDDCSKTIQETITIVDVSGFPNIKLKNNDYLFYYGLDGRLLRK
jgi:hypothetical protein